MKFIGVFCGGFSSEFDISIKSATTIIANFPNNYQAIQIIVKEGLWEGRLNDKQGKFDLNTCSIDFENQQIKLDGAIVYIHGEPGENGKIQAYLDLFKIPYVNSNVLASSLSFDKWYCNQFLKSFEIPIAKSTFLLKNQEYNTNEIIKSLGLPVFVKPTDSGSSYGITKVKKEIDLESAIQVAFKEGDSIVIESFLDGTEVTCGVYRSTSEIIALPLTEIVSENEFFDYEAKYLGKSKEITPARINEEEKKKVQDLSKSIYQILGLKSIARIDFILVNSEPYLIEVNTTPGFSNESIVPKMLDCAGIPIKDFWLDILKTELQ